MFIYLGVLLGLLKYVTLTRHEFFYSINKASQFMHSPTIILWQLVLLEDEGMSIIQISPLSL